MNELKEFLTLAARACGLSPFDGAHYWHEGAGQWVRWNPLAPGDGAEMEDKLGISIIRTAKGYVTAEHMELTKMMQERIADHPDEGTARRWASLRVAAAIGGAMK
jgi:hypothetical protein